MFKYLYTFFFFLIILVFSSGYYLKIPEKALNSEKRELVSFQDLKEAKGIKGLKENLVLFLSDNFYLRSTSIYYFNRLKFFLGLPINSDVIVGKDNWFFYNKEKLLEDHLGIERISKKVLDKKANSIVENYEQLKNEGVKYIKLIPLDKISVYKEKFPFTEKVINDSKLLKLEKSLKDLDFDNFISLKRVVEFKQLGQLYYKTDTHWNNLGSLIGTKLFLEKFYPEVSLSLDNLKIVSSKIHPGPDLSNMLGFKNITKEKINTYNILSNKFKLDFLEVPESLEWANKSQTRFFKTVNESPLINENLIVFRDSFMTSMQPYISAVFKNVIYIWKAYDKNFVAYVTENFYTPDTIIDETVERNLF